MDEKRKQQDQPATTTAGEDAPAERPTSAAAGDRRDFLRRAGLLTVGACALGGLAGALRSAVPDFWEGPPVRFPVGRLADFKMRTLTFIRRHDLYVLHDDEGFGAFSARCTHLGCTVQRTGEGFVCPCHGARFDPVGRVLAGPARRDLPWYPLRLDADSRLWVSSDQQAPPGTTTQAELERERGGGRS